MAGEYIFTGNYFNSVKQYFHFNLHESSGMDPLCSVFSSILRWFVCISEGHGWTKPTSLLVGHEKHSIGNVNHHDSPLHAFRVSYISQKYHMGYLHNICCGFRCGHINQTQNRQNTLKIAITLKNVKTKVKRVS